MIALECKSVQKSFGSVVALESANIAVKSGEIRAILGGNGSGKSTLSKILAGTVKPNHGEVILYGKPARLNSPSRSKRQGVVMTSQELSLFPNHTVEMNLTMCGIPKSLGIFTDKKKVKEQAIHILSELKLAHLVGKTVEGLAPNEKYMVEFAKALVQKPKVLIVDEITSALYREEVELVRKTLFRLKEEGVLILFISHRMSEIYSICDSVTVMRNGETIATVGIREKTQNELLSLMSGREVSDFENTPTRTVKHREGPPILAVPKLHLPKFNTELELTVQPGEFVGIAGLQGHGQSELVRTVFGLASPIQLTLNGNERHISSPRQAVTSGMAFISGDREREGTFGVRSLSENLGVVTELVMGNSGPKADAVLTNHGVKFNSAKQPIRTLSGGNQQKVVIARWTTAHPAVLLADDPTKGIDVQARLDVHHTLRTLMENGSGIVLVSSDDEELVQIAHMSPSAKILVMYEGQVVRVLAGSEITTENIISASILRGA